MSYHPPSIVTSFHHAARFGHPSNLSTVQEYDVVGRSYTVGVSINGAIIAGVGVLLFVACAIVYMSACCSRCLPYCRKHYGNIGTCGLVATSGPADFAFPGERTRSSHRHRSWWHRHP